MPTAHIAVAAEPNATDGSEWLGVAHFFSPLYSEGLPVDSPRGLYRAEDETLTTSASSIPLAN